MNDSKLYLIAMQSHDKKIEAKIDELYQLKQMIIKITPTLKDTTGGSGASDKLGAAVAKIVDLENEINQSIDDLIDKKRFVNRILEQIQDPDQYTVLHSRYVLHKSFEQIACEMNMTYRNVCYINGKALQEFDRIAKTFH